MYIRCVTAQAFGPLLDQTLELSPGLTVVHGDNESAKSTWHAAIYAALCGRRRRPGASKGEREFTRRRRPWHADSWQVRCEVVLDDGRCITLQHDLDGKVDCRATDERGRDVSPEIMVDGAPDGSRWLGLNRRTFAATACVSQAELLSVLDSADELQADLQRAAATAGRDETAASALEALKKFRTERIGLDRANSVKPLRRATVSAKATSENLAAAREAHEEYLRLLVAHERAERSATEASRQREAAEVAIEGAERLLDAVRQLHAAEHRAEQAQQVATDRRSEAQRSRATSMRAAELAADLPAGEPGSRTDDDELAQQAARALGAWDAAPEVPHLTGMSAVQLRRRLAELPPPPEGDVRLDPALERLREEYLKAAAVLAASDRAAVPAPTPGQAALLETPPSLNDDPLAEGARAHRSWLGGALAASGVVLLVVGQTVAGAAVLALALAATAVMLKARRSGALAGGSTHCEAGLDTTARAQALAARQAFQSWQTSHETARSKLSACQVELAAALQDRGFEGVDVLAAYAAYEHQCDRNAAQRAAAEQRSTLAQQLDSRVASEGAVSRASSARAKAVTDLHRAAAAIGLARADDDQTAESVRDWLQERQLNEERVDEQRRRWQLLQELLDGRTVGDLAAAASAAEAVAQSAERQATAALADVAACSTAVTAAEAEALSAAERTRTSPSLDPDTARWAAERRGDFDEAAAEALVQRRRAERYQADSRERELLELASQLRGQVTERERSLPDVTEAEEAADHAARELAHLRSLDEVLDLTGRYLATARDRAYSDLAPVLNAALERWLPEVTNGRYRRATVDPETLEVKVELPTGELREAGLLSVGTSEQIYLLLRVALTEHLASRSVICPLLLDDVTVQADPIRTEAILEMCKTLADGGRQVVIFAQEPAVAAWAERRLDAGRDSLIRLGLPAAA